MCLGPSSSGGGPEEEGPKPLAGRRSSSGTAHATVSYHGFRLGHARFQVRPITPCFIIGDVLPILGSNR